jgi:ribosomal protein L40E
MCYHWLNSVCKCGAEISYDASQCHSCEAKERQYIKDHKAEFDKELTIIREKLHCNDLSKYSKA